MRLEASLQVCTFVLAYGVFPFKFESTLAFNFVINCVRVLLLIFNLSFKIPDSFVNN